MTIRLDPVVHGASTGVSRRRFIGRAVLTGVAGLAVPQAVRPDAGRAFGATDVSDALAGRRPCGGGVDGHR